MQRGIELNRLENLFVVVVIYIKALIIQGVNMCLTKFVKLKKRVFHHLKELRLYLEYLFVLHILKAGHVIQTYG